MEGLEGTHTVDLLEEIILEEALAAVDAGEDTEIRDYGKKRISNQNIFSVEMNFLKNMWEKTRDFNPNL